MAFQIKAKKHAYTGELVKGQSASIKIVPAPSDGERLHEFMAWALDGVCKEIENYCHINYILLDDLVNIQLTKHPFKKKKGQLLYIGKQFEHTKNEVWREYHNVGKHYTHKELLESISEKVGAKLNKWEMEHFTDAQIKRWNRYMTYWNQKKHGRDCMDKKRGTISGDFDQYKVRIIEIKDDNDGICGLDPEKL